MRWAEEHGVGWQAAYAAQVERDERAVRARAEAFGMNADAAVAEVRRLARETVLRHQEAADRVMAELLSDWLGGWGKVRPEVEGEG